MLETLFGSKLRVKLLRCLFTHQDERYFVRQLAGLTGEDSTNISRELARLAKVGLLTTETAGRQKYYQANKKSPVFQEIRGLVNKIPVVEPAGQLPMSSLLKGRLKISKTSLTAFCRLHQIKKMSLFGSVLRADFKPDSDIDILVEFKAGNTPGFLKLGGMEEELCELTGGRKVDLRTPQDLSSHFRGRVMKEALVICP